MARKEDIFDNEIEIIDFDIADIEDRIVSNTETDIMEELPEITDAEEVKEIELPEIADVEDEKEEFSVVEPEEALAEVTQTVAMPVPEEVKEEKISDDNKDSESSKKDSVKSAEKDKKPAKKKKKSGSDIVRSFLMMICVCVLVYAGYQLTMIFLEYKEAGDEYKEITEFTTDENVTYNANYDLGEPFNPNFTPTQVNWQELLSLNSEIYAWIEFENSELGINYPVAQGIDNLYYLEHTVNGTANSSGSIYIGYENDPYFQDTNTFIYGHNMKNGSMFGNLKKYKNAEFYAGNEYFWIYTPDSRMRFKIFACYEPAADSDTYTWWSDFCDEYTTYLENVKVKAMYDTGVNVNPDERIVTLSTCTGSDAYRFVVQAKLVYKEFK